MIKPLASELLKSCLIDSHLPQSVLNDQDLPEHVEIGELPDEFSTQIAPAEITQKDLAEFRSQTDAFFAENGLLKAAGNLDSRPYEYRAQQHEMASAVANALSNLENLAIEAPTGVGKSFAYLVPAILYSKLTGRPAIVTTETISLQEQLINKDLPLLQDLLKVKFKAALAKGRRNYLCLRRLSLAAGEHQSEYISQPSVLGDIDRIYEWSETTADGNRDNANFHVQNESWGYVCCEAGNCSYPKCRFRRECFYRKAREEWAQADIVVANHALFFTDLKMQIESGDDSGGILPVYGSVVIDEAHTLEDNAAAHLGLYLTYGGFNAFLNRLYNPDNGRGLLMRKGNSSLELRTQAAALKSLAKQFFGQFQDYLDEGEDSIRAVNQRGLFLNTLQMPLAKFRSDLGDYALEQANADFRSELEGMLVQCDSYIDSIDAFLNMTLPDSVYWVEEDSRQLVLQASPLNVDEILSRELFGKEIPVICTSATLTVDRRFNYFRSRTGFAGGPTRLLNSPFDPQKVKLYALGSMPDPSQDDYERQLFKQLQNFITLSDGKAFVLFTSYALMRRAADALEDFFFQKRIKLLLQGGDLSRSMLLKEFKNDVRSVLFGTDSFWTGVDVPGDALSNVIITKLPFSVPSHPLMKARSERIIRMGGNAFFDYSLPEAVLKFRQGAGRLIRSTSDSGMIVVMDSRIVSKRYGKSFLNSLPPYLQEFC